MQKILVLISLCFCFYVFNVEASKPEDCQACHQQQVSDWGLSDHAKAMAEVSSASVLANFDNVWTEHYSQKAKFFKDDTTFKVELTEDGKTQTYTIAYTFGHYPLQQYLVATEGGRYQVLPFAWDSREKNDGGQRWYPNYALEDIKPQDRLHWKQPLQNWNGMCADCHSDGLKRNYSIENDSFSTQYDNINVGCMSCHGDMSGHQTRSYANKSPLSKADTEQVLRWLRKEEDSVAQLVTNNNKPASKEQKEQKQSAMETCFACHSLRSSLSDGIQADEAFLDQFSPNFIQPNLYFADGQIKEEVYVYGSFLQSKMFRAGVSCTDCHNPHTMKVKTQTNGLCLQCHSSEVYQQKSHIQHPFDTAAGQCVSCHMPERTYMGVDDRRDHSFVIPRPHISEEFKTPNACVQCHQDKDNKWATQQVTKWYGAPNAVTPAQRQFLTLQSEYYLPIDQLIALINNTELSVMKRASSIRLLPNATQSLDDETAKQWLESEEPLIRLAIAQVGQLLPEAERLKTYSKLLSDEFKAIRVAAANNLVGVNLPNSQTVQAAFDELTISGEVNSWRGEGNINRSLVYSLKGQVNDSINALKHAIKTDPYFDAAYINLAETYRLTNETRREKEVLNQGLANIPNSSILHYSVGMQHIRSGQKQQALNFFQRASELEPENTQFVYLYLLSLDSVGETAKALNILENTIDSYQGNYQLIQLGLSFSQKMRDAKRFKIFREYSETNGK